MLPIPDKLRGRFKIDHEFENSELFVKGQVVCSCGCEEFAIMYFGRTEEDYLVTKKIDEEYILALKLICSSCNEEFILFCDNLDGHDGFVCDIDKRQKNIEILSSLIYEKTECIECKNNYFYITCKIESSGQEDFL